jgi:hypothetical protein
VCSRPGTVMVSARNSDEIGRRGGWSLPPRQRGNSRTDYQLGPDVCAPFRSSLSRRTRLLQMVYLRYMLCGVGELKGDAPAMPAGREAPAFDYSHLVRHVGMDRIMCDRGT